MGRLKLADLTPSQRKVICNGCGPSNWGRMSRFVPQFVFAEAGNQHDLAYWEGGGLLDKFGADLQFLVDELSATLRQPKCSWPKYAFWAFVYFGLLTVAVRSFKWGRPRTTEDLALIIEEGHNGV